MGPRGRRAVFSSLVRPGLAEAGSEPMAFHVVPLKSGMRRERPNVNVADGVIEPTRLTCSSISLVGRRTLEPKEPDAHQFAGRQRRRVHGVRRRLRQLGMAAMVAGYGSDGMKAGPTPGECVRLASTR